MADIRLIISVGEQWICVTSSSVPFPQIPFPPFITVTVLVHFWRKFGVQFARQTNPPQFSTIPFLCSKYPFIPSISDHHIIRTNCSCARWTQKNHQNCVCQTCEHPFNNILSLLQICRQLSYWNQFRRSFKRMRHLTAFVLLAVFSSDSARKIVDENSQEALWEAVKHRYVQWNVTIKDGLAVYLFPF